jgi:hypothetical protein
MDENSQRNFFNIIKKDPAEVKSIRQYQKLKIKKEFLKEDIKFLKKCRNAEVFPTFIKINVAVHNSRSHRAIDKGRKEWLKYEIRMKYSKLNEINEKLYQLYNTISLMFKEKTEYWFTELKRIENTCIKKGEEKTNKLEKKFKQLTNFQNVTKDKQQKDAPKKKIPEEENFNDYIVNLSSKELTEQQKQILKKGLKHKFIPKTPPIKDIVVSLESDLKYIHLDNEKFDNNNEKRLIKSEICKVIKEFKDNESKKIRNNNRKEYNIVKELKEMDLYYVKADKGKKLVIMDKKDYDEKVELAINEGPFNQVKVKKNWKDGVPVNVMQTEVKQTLTNLVNNNNLNQFTAQSLVLSNPRMPFIYGVPKIHKLDSKMRLIVSNISTPTSKIAKYVTKEFSKLNYQSVFSVKNSQDLTQKLINQKVDETEVLISFDVVSLFPSIPIDQAIEIVLEFLNSTELDRNKKASLIEMIKVCSRLNYCQFRENIYRQNDGLPIGSPLSPLIAELYLRKFELTYCKESWWPRVFYRYVDDCLAIIKKKDLSLIVENLNNSIFQKLKFTFELEKENQIPFLDILVKKNGENLGFAVFRKSIDIPRFIGKDSFHPNSHKNASLQFLINRLLSIPMSNEDFELEWKEIIKIAIMNGFDETICLKILEKKALKINTQLKSTMSDKGGDNKEMNFVSMPFFPPLTNKIKTILKKRDITLIHNSRGKLSDLLGNTKNKINNEMKSGIYMLECENCDKKYIGQTRRKLYEREIEHTNTRTKCNVSSVAEHMIQNNHKMKEIKLLEEINGIKSLDSYESYYLNKYKKDSLLNDQPAGNAPSFLFDLG